MLKTVFSPHPGKQSEFLASTADNILFGGARGPGKSFALCYKAAFSAKRYYWKYKGKRLTNDEYLQFTAQGIKCTPVVEKIAIDYPDYVAILIRRSHPQLERNLKPETEKLYKLYGAKWQEKQHRYVFPSEAKIYLVHCKDSRALDDYIGGNYNFIGFDEANQFYEEWIDKISTSNRTVNPELKPQTCLTSNPGGLGHAWLKKKYVDRCPPIPGAPTYSKQFDITYTLQKSGKPYFDKNGVSWQYIPSLVFENPSLMDNNPEYVQTLNNLKPALRKMWLLGEWGGYAGMFFDKWNEDEHTIPVKEFRYGEEFSKHTHSLYRFYDYGTKAPFVCLFAAVDRNGNMVIFDEIVETGLASSAQAKLVNEYTLKKYKLTPDDFEGEYADPQYWAATSEKDNLPYSPERHYADEGIYLQQGVRDRKVGAKIIYDAFEPVKGGVPRIRFTDNCTYSIEFIPALASKENDPEDVDSDGEDHCVHPDTLINTTGGLKKIKDLVGTEGYCYGWDGERIGVTKFYNVKQTRKNAKVLELGLDDGSYLRATPDHQIMLRDGTYRELKDLKEGDSLMPFYSTVDYHGHFNINLNNGERIGAHRLVYNDLVCQLPADTFGYVVHHMDFNKFNNNPDNLELMTRADHTSYHAKYRLPVSEQTRMKLRESHHKKQTDKKYIARMQAHVTNIRPLTKEWHASEDGSKWHREHALRVAENRVLLDLICEECGNPFQSIQKWAKYCHANCNAKANRRNRKEKYGISDDMRYAQSNHKVAYVRDYGILDTYDMTTNFGNFATESIIIHNSYDALRYGGTIILPGLTVVADKRKGWRSEMARRYAQNYDKGDDGSTWRTV